MDTKILQQISYGLYAIGAYDGKKPTACIVNTIFQISNEPPMVALSMNKDNYTYDAIKATNQFTVSILTEEVEQTLVGKLGFASGRDMDKLEGMKYITTEKGLPMFMEGTKGGFLCEVVSEMDATTHMVILGKIIEVDEVENKDNPITYKYYHEVFKGKAPKKAPTYVEEEEPVKNEKKESISYVCEVCGYIYEGDESGVPEDYECPICNVDYTNFKRV